MTLLDVLNAIRQAGGKLWVDAGAVRIKAPPGVVGPEAKAVLSANRTAVVQLFATESVNANDNDANSASEPAVEALPSTSPRHWSPALTDQQNLDVDQFMGYAVTADVERAAIAWEQQRPAEAEQALQVALWPWRQPGIPSHERCFKCGGNFGWDREDVKGRQRVTCRRCGTFIGYSPCEKQVLVS